MSVARNVVFNPFLSPGGGATEMAVSVRLHQKAKTMQGIESWPYRAVADALEVIPRTLVQNAGGNAIRVLTELRVRKFLNNSGFGCGYLATHPPARLPEDDQVAWHLFHFFEASKYPSSGCSLLTADVLCGDKGPGSGVPATTFGSGPICNQSNGIPTRPLFTPLTHVHHFLNAVPY